jgi:transposase
LVKASENRQLDVLEPLRDQSERSLLEEAKTHPIIRMISTVPGMGRIRSAQVVAVVATPHRFRTRQQFWSYCGLAIVTRSSADWVYVDGQKERRQVLQTRGLTRKRNPLLKQVFKGAATTVITQLADHSLHEDYQRMIDSGIKPTSPGSLWHVASRRSCCPCGSTRRCTTRAATAS